MNATVGPDGKITIPREICEKLHLTPGTILEFDENANFLKAKKKLDRERLQALAGFAKEELAGKTTAEWLDELRGPVELPPADKK